MSNVHRWRTDGTTRRDDDGHWVLYSDHQAEVERLKAENARLTRALDDAASRCENLRELADQSAYESGVAFRRLQQAQERHIRAIRRMPVPIDQAERAIRAIAAIEALNETEGRDDRKDIY